MAVVEANGSGQEATKPSGSLEAATPSVAAAVLEKAPQGTANAPGLTEDSEGAMEDAPKIQTSAGTDVQAPRKES